MYLYILASTTALVLVICMPIHWKNLREKKRNTNVFQILIFIIHALFCIGISFFIHKRTHSISILIYGM